MEYYVYVYLDSRERGNYVYSNGLKFEFKPFYVGKGKGERMYDHIKRVNYLNEKNLYKVNMIKEILEETNDIPIVNILFDNLTEKEAFELEIKTIASIGIDNLTNIRKGGNGGVTWTDEKSREIIIEKIKSTKSGVTYEELVGEERAAEWKEKLRKETKKRWEENREQIINSLPKGKDHHMYGKTNSFKMTKESVDKIRKAKMGSKNPNSKKYVVTSPEGEEFIINGNMRKFCEEKKISAEMMYRIANGSVKQKEHRGWKCCLIAK